MRPPSTCCGRLADVRLGPSARSLRTPWENQMTDNSPSDSLGSPDETRGGPDIDAAVRNASDARPASPRRDVATGAPPVSACRPRSRYGEPTERSALSGTEVDVDAHDGAGAVGDAGGVVAADGVEL